MIDASKLPDFKAVEVRWVYADRPREPEHAVMLVCPVCKSEDWKMIKLGSHLHPVLLCSICKVTFAPNRQDAFALNTLKRIPNYEVR